MKSETMTANVRDLLYEDIMEGRLPAGTRLTIVALSKRYKTSATPVRAALFELQGRGLVVTNPRRGARVRRIDEDYIRNIFEVREAMITAIVPRCIDSASNSDLNKLEALHLEFVESVESGDVITILRTNRSFYRFMYDLAENPEALDVIERTWATLDTLRLRYGFRPLGLQNMIAAHKELLKAFWRRDTAKALEVKRMIIAKALEDLILLSRKVDENAPVKSGKSRKTPARTPVVESGV